jgi:Mce-associated membrane protein
MSGPVPESSGRPESPETVGWYPDPLRPDRDERLWDGEQWTDLTRPRRETPVDPEPEPDAEPTAEPTAEPAAVSAGRRLTAVLTALAVVLVAVVGLLTAYLWGPLGEDTVVSRERPVLLDQAAERAAVDVAAQAALAFTERSFETYDEEVDAAAAMMTAPYAEEFRRTTDEVRPSFVENEVEVTATIEAQGVMTASANQVEALVFLTQFVTRGGEETAFTPYRIKVTLVDDPDRGWLVSAVDTR